MNHLADPDGQMIGRVLESFAMSSENPAPTRKALGARKRNERTDFSLLKRWIVRCESSHGMSCHRTWSEELLTTRMIDVSARKIVQCPSGCKYVALSYVWGSVVPEANALENGRLPQTLEDAITVTKQLGLNFLWIDALCIDQKPSPYKTQQLSIMDVIYQCASVTVISLSGDNSETGLPGVSFKTPREPQGAEVINGKELLSVFPMLHQDMERVKYPSRAWTMQEAMLTRRRLVFTNNQVHYWCNSASFSESIDDEFDPANYTENYHPPKQESWFNPAQTSQYTLQERLIIGEEDYRECVYNYSGRQMTNDSDSLNAFLGVANYLRKSWFPKGLTWGMPLVDFPQALRWYHPRWVKPRRRPEFPSWSWTGWEGQATYSGSLDLPSKQERGRYDMSTDMTARFIAIDDQVLTLDAYTVTLEVRTEPFSDAFIPGTDELLGPIKEGNVLHSNTLPSKTEDFLVVERIKYRTRPDGPFREDVYMLLLDWDDGVVMRRTKVRLYLGLGVDFDGAKPQMQRIQMK